MAASRFSRFAALHSHMKVLNLKKETKKTSNNNNKKLLHQNQKQTKKITQKKNNPKQIQKKKKKKKALQGFFLLQRQLYRDTVTDRQCQTFRDKKESKRAGKNSHFAAVKRSKEVTFPCCRPRHLPGQLVPVTWNTCLLRTSLQNLMLGNAKAFFLSAVIAFFPLISRKETGDDHLHH